MTTSGGLTLLSGRPPFLPTRATYPPRSVTKRWALRTSAPFTPSPRHVPPGPNGEKAPLINGACGFSSTVSRTNFIGPKALTKTGGRKPTLRYAQNGLVCSHLGVKVSSLKGNLSECRYSEGDGGAEGREEQENSGHDRSCDACD